MSGKLQVRTRRKDALDCTIKDSGRGSSGEGDERSSSGSNGPSEAELQALFNSIDKDGSGEPQSSSLPDAEQPRLSSNCLTPPRPRAVPQGKGHECLSLKFIDITGPVSCVIHGMCRRRLACRCH